MSLDNTIYTMSNINALLGSTLGFVNAKQNGVPTSYALSDMGNSIMNGAIRNAASRDIQRATGSYLGYAVNNAAGYGNPVADYQGTIGTMNALMLSTPLALFNSSCHRGSYFNHCGCNSFGYGFGMPSYFTPMGFYC